MTCGSGSVDKAPDLQWIFAGSKLERRKYFLLHKQTVRSLLQILNTLLIYFLNAVMESIQNTFIQNSILNTFLSIQN